MAWEYSLMLVLDDTVEYDSDEERRAANASELTFYGIRAKAWDKKNGVIATTAGVWRCGIPIDEPLDLTNDFIRETYEEELATLKAVLGDE